MSQPVISQPSEAIEVFSTALGWMALVTESVTSGSRGRGPALTNTVVTQLSFGHVTPLAARRALERSSGAEGERAKLSAIAKRLQAYADGEPDDFIDIEVRDYATTDFKRAVIERCRAIPYGETMTYGELAYAVDAPRAARAVGNCMATNRVPILVPCHRVLATGGRLGGYSAGEGVRLKLRLLEMEAVGVGS